MDIPVASSASSLGSGNGARAAAGNLGGLNVDDFLKLMIAELQNQDPLNPLDNAQFLSQIATIREIGATAALSKTLEAVLLGQNVSSAASLMGKQVSAVADSGNSVTGIVERVTIAGNDVKVVVHGEPVRLSNVREILSA
jgi:flagellar basal-body rod modification protein FlgD